MGKQLGPCRYTSPMRIFLYGISSFSYWLTAECRPNAHCGVGVSALKSCVPHRKTVEYLEKVFPALGVRFIALTDRYDSFFADAGERNIVLPVKNFINDSYCRDISVKVKSQLAVRRRSGE